MRSAIFLALGVAVLAGLFWLFKPQPAPPPTPTPAHAAAHSGNGAAVIADEPPADRFELRVQDRKLASGPAVLKVQQDDAVEIHIVSDQAEELHLHGYNLKLELTPNQPATLVFKADRSGRFEYELEHAGIELGALEVSPR